MWLNSFQESAQYSTPESPGATGAAGILILILDTASGSQTLSHTD